MDHCLTSILGFQLSLVTGEELEIEYEIDGWFYVSINHVISKDVAILILASYCYILLHCLLEIVMQLFTNSSHGNQTRHLARPCTSVRMDAILDNYLFKRCAGEESTPRLGWENSRTGPRSLCQQILKLIVFYSTSNKLNPLGLQLFAPPSVSF